MAGLDISTLGLFIGALGAVFSFWLGRRIRARWMARQQEKDRARRLANETRQQRRARERREQGKR